MPDALQNVTYLPEETQESRSTALSTGLEGLDLARPVRIDFQPDQDINRNIVSINNLYPIREVISPDLTFALSKLETVLPILDSAVLAMQENDVPLADDSIQRVAATLPDLFLCSSLGEGFSAMIVGLHYAITNMGESVVTLDQLLEIRLATKQLKSEPFMKHSDAIARLIKLEDAGLVVDVPVNFLPEAAE